MSRLSLAPARPACHFQAIATRRFGTAREREFEMRDEIYDRLWVDHHENFSRDLDRAFAALRAAIARLPVWDGTTAQLLALVAAFAITGLSFNATAA